MGNHTSFPQPFCALDFLSFEDGTHDSTASSGSLGGSLGALITNADQGVLYSWEFCPEANSVCVDHLTAVTNGSVSSDAALNLPGHGTIEPMLQAQDGSFFGTITTDVGNELVRFDQSGNLLAARAGDYQPAIATADGGLIATTSSGSAVAMDANLNITGVAASLSGGGTQGWTGNVYTTAPLAQVTAVPVAVATPPFASTAGANPSVNGTSPLCHDDRDKLVAEYGEYNVLDSSYPKPWPRFTVSCLEFSNKASSQYFTFAEINVPSPSLGEAEFGWALIKNPLVAPAKSGYGLDAWRQIFGASRIINSGYRDPLQNDQAGGVSASRHMLGDAVDLRNQTGTQDEWQAMFDAAGDSTNGTGARADFREPVTGPCKLGCVHADWRRHDRGKYSQ